MAKANTQTPAPPADFSPVAVRRLFTAANVRWQCIAVFSLTPLAWARRRALAAPSG